MSSFNTKNESRVSLISASRHTFSLMVKSNTDKVSFHWRHALYLKGNRSSRQMISASQDFCSLIKWPKTFLFHQQVLICFTNCCCHFRIAQQAFCCVGQVLFWLKTCQRALQMVPSPLLMDCKTYGCEHRFLFNCRWEEIMFLPVCVWISYKKQMDFN